MTILAPYGSLNACTVAAVLSILLPVSAAPASQLRRSSSRPLQEQLRSEHQRVLDELNVKESTGRTLDFDDPRIPPLLRRGWDLAGAWAAAYLEAHPTPSAHDLERIFDGFALAPKGTKSQYGNFIEYTSYSLRGGAFRIAPSVYVVQASYGVKFLTGTFMVVARNRAGHFEALWNIKQLAEKHYAQKDKIGRWMYLVRESYYSGPLSVGRLLSVPSSTDGHPRFLVDAFQSADGGTQGAQLSIWDWDGAEARPLLVDWYDYVAGNFGALRFDGTTVRIPTKESLGILFSCGACDEPQGLWKVRITSNGVTNLGHRFVNPELQ